MEGDAGPQVVSVHERLDYGGHHRPCYQYQFMPRNDNEGLFGPNQFSVLGRAASNSQTSTSRCRGEADKKAHLESRDWQGFMLMSQNETQKGSITTGKPNVRLTLESAETARQDRLRKQSISTSWTSPEAVSLTRAENHDASTLSLKLCSDSLSHFNDGGNPARIAKRHRSSSPGNQSQPLCQVDDCHADLKNAKDYHRRHKVCEFHSKATQSLVQQKMQRFCQQCSRFHLLQEFDEGKRSCRRRLAGHNKRRRKSNCEVLTNCASFPETPNGTDILSIVSTLTQLQAANTKDKLRASTVQHESIVADKNTSVVPCLPTTFVKDSPLLPYQQHKVPTGSHRTDHGDKKNLVKSLVGFSQEAIVLAIQDILGGQGNGSKVKDPKQPNSSNDQSSASLFSPSSSSPEDHGNASNSTAKNLQFDDLSANSLKRNGNYASNSTAKNLQFDDLSASSLKRNGNSFLARLPSMVNDKESENTSSHHISIDLERPSYSDVVRPPVEQNFFPTESGSGLRKGTGSRTADLSVPNQQLSDSQETGSDQSPDSSSSCSQELSGRIIFKLCDPIRMADIPQDYKSQLQEWLSVTPCFMEGYMRPGCVLLTVFLSMPHHAWKKLVVDFEGSLERLVRLSSPVTDIWNMGRILVQVEQRRALVVDGKVKKVTYSRNTERPLLQSVRPLAVIAGQETTLTVRGYNLFPESKILCAYNGRYVLHEVPSRNAVGVDIDSSAFACGIASEREGYDLQVQRVHFPGGPPNVFGRCFIEVERDLAGNILPLIVADPEICSELALLEKELDRLPCSEIENILSERCMEKEVQAMIFLNELGWIFQSTYFPNDCTVSLSKFKGLLSFAVHHDWCALVRKLLDLLFVVGGEDKDEALGILSEVSLVHQAVKRKCKNMVELLLHYVPCEGRLPMGKVFTAINKGPAGLTPLHIAASISGAEDIIDALTNDPSEIGLNGWKSAYDDSGRTPEHYAHETGHLSYIHLIEQKLQFQPLPFINITVSDTVEDPAIHPSQGRSMNEPHVHCKMCRVYPYRLSRRQKSTSFYRPIMTMMVAVAAICATVALLLKGPPRVGSIVYSLKWGGINYGSL